MQTSVLRTSAEAGAPQEDEGEGECEGELALAASSIISAVTWPAAPGSLARSCAAGCAVAGLERVCVTRNVPRYAARPALCRSRDRPRTSARIAPDAERLRGASRPAPCAPTPA